MNPLEFTIDRAVVTERIFAEFLRVRPIDLEKRIDGLDSNLKDVANKGGITAFVNNDDGALIVTGHDPSTVR